MEGGELRLHGRAVGAPEVLLGVADELVDPAAVLEEADQAAQRGRPFLAGHGAEVVEALLPARSPLDALGGKERARRLGRRGTLGERELDDGVLARADRGDELAGVHGLPAVREVEPELHLGVVEAVADEVALARVVAEHDAVDVAQVAVALDGAGLLVRGQCFDALHGALGATVRVGMGRRPRRDPPALALGGADPVQGHEHLRHLVRVVAVARHVAQAELVRLGLVVPAELEEHQLEALHREPGVRTEVLARDHRHPEAEVGELRGAHLLHRVARRDVADLVAEHRGQLGLGVEVGEDAAGDEDRPAGQGEGVDHRVVHHREGPRQVGLLRCRGQAVADARHILLQLGVVVPSQLGDGVGGLLLAERDLLLLADQRKLALAGCRVR